MCSGVFLCVGYIATDGAIPLLPFHAFMAHIGNIYHFTILRAGSLSFPNSFPVLYLFYYLLTWQGICSFFTAYSLVKLLPPMTYRTSW